MSVRGMPVCSSDCPTCHYFTHCLTTCFFSFLAGCISQLWGLLQCAICQDVQHFHESVAGSAVIFVLLLLFVFMALFIDVLL